MAINTVVKGNKTFKDSAAADTYNVAADAVRVTIAGKMKAGDVINVEGLASEYTVKAAGRTITLSNGTQTITFQLDGTAGAAKIAFLDGSLDASFNGKVAMLGAQKLSGKYVAVNDSALGATDSSAVDFSGGTGGSSNGSTFNLTTGVDSIVGTSGDDTINANDIFLGLTAGNAVYANGLGGADVIDGGAGNDTLNVMSSSAISVPAGASVSNVENAKIVSGATVDGDVSGWTGLAKLDVTAVGGTNSKSITAAATTDVSYSDKAMAAAAVKVDGGKAISIKTTDTISGTTGAITVGGTTAASGAVSIDHTIKGADTKVGGAIAVTGGTTVTVKQTAANAVNTANTFGAVTVTGGASTTSVTSTQTNAATKSSTVAGVVNSAIDIIDSNTTSGTATTSTKAGTIATVSLSGFAAAKVASAALTTLNLSGTGTSVGTWEGGSTASTNTTLALNLNAATITGAITDNSNQYTTINIAKTGASTLKTSAAAIVDTALTKINISGSGDLTANLTTASVTAIDASSSSGKNTLTVDATSATYAGGSGNDTITIAAAPTKAISGGSGTDELVLNVAAATFSNPSANTKISGFETLGLGASATGSYDATGFNALHVGAVLTGNSTFTNVAAGTALLVDAVAAKTIAYALKDATGTSDSVSITVGNATTDGLDLATATTIDITGIETANIASTGKATAASINKIKLADTTATTSVLTKIVVTGAQDTTVSDSLTGTAKIATVDASAATGAIDLSGVHVSASGANIKGSLTNTNVLTGGAGADTIVGGAKADTITTGAGQDMVTGGAGQDTFILAKNANGNTYATITDATLGASTAADKINMTGLTDTATANAGPADGVLGAKISLAGTAAFADYLAAAASGHTADTDTDTLLDKSVVTWFQYGGDTYIVEDNNTANAFVNGSDQVIKLSGTIDLSKAALASGVLTLLNS